MFGFLKRLFKGFAKRKTRQDISPTMSVAAPIAVQPVTPIAVPPIAVTPPAAPVAAPTPIDPPFETLSTLALDDEPEVFGMVQSLGNPDAYMVGLIGEADHATAVNHLREGSPIRLELEADNPHDHSAIAAVDAHGRVIGYIAPDSWLREAIYGSGASFSARVLVTDIGARGFREVVLEVEPSEEPLRERRYQPPALA